MQVPSSARLLFYTLQSLKFNHHFVPFFLNGDPCPRWEAWDKELVGFLAFLNFTFGPVSYTFINTLHTLLLMSSRAHAASWITLHIAVSLAYLFPRGQSRTPPSISHTVCSNFGIFWISQMPIIEQRRHFLGMRHDMTHSLHAAETNILEPLSCEGPLLCFEEQDAETNVTEFMAISDCINHFGRIASSI